MKTSNLLYLITGLSLAILPACGEPDDPSKNKDDNNGTTVMDMTTGPNDMGNTGKDMPATGTDMPATGKDMPATGTDMPATGTDMPAGDECAVRAMYTGQIGNTANAKKGGGGAFALGDGAYVADSGLNTVVERIKAALDAGTIQADVTTTADVSEDELVFAAGAEIQITGAIVTSTSFERDDGTAFTLATRLTFQDQKVGVLAFIDGITMDKNGAPIIVKVGDKLNFKVKAAKGFGGTTPQISQVIEVEKVGANEDVGVMEKTGQDVVIADFQKMVRVHGIVDSAMGTSCGGKSLCYDIKHGDKTTVFRIGDQVSRLPMKGDCITYVGPVGAFPGPFATGNITVQLDAVNFTWYRGPFAN